MCVFVCICVCMCVFVYIYVCVCIVSHHRWSFSCQVPSSFSPCSKKYCFRGDCSHKGHGRLPRPCMLCLVHAQIRTRAHAQIHMPHTWTFIYRLQLDIHIQITHTCTEHVVYTHVYTHNTHTYIHAGLDGPFRWCVEAFGHVTPLSRGGRDLMHKLRCSNLCEL